MISEDLISRGFCFEHKEGDLLYPVRIQRRGASRPRFQIWKDSKENTEDVEEAEMARKVLGEGYAVRMSTLDGQRAGGYRAYGGRAVTKVRTDC